MVDCHAWAEDDFDIHRRLLAKANTERIPIRGSIALTHRCSLRCRHCYLGCQEEIRKHKDEELTTAEIENIIDQAVSLGTLHMMITGGEVMLREDFTHIYEYIINKGIILTVLTNATLVTDDIIKSFKKFPPRVIEITSYGATPETYEYITQVKGSYNRYTDGLNKLKQAGVRFSLKSVIMTANQHELHNIEKIARKYGIKYRYDTAIFPCIPHEDNGMRSNLEPGDYTEQGIDTPLQAPLSLRLPVDEMLKLDFQEDQRCRDWLKFYDWAQQRKLKKNKFLYLCSAGRTAYHINPYGKLQPCLVTYIHTADLRKVSFKKGWSEEIVDLLKIEADENYPCIDCEAIDMCSGCPSIFLLEQGKLGKISDYMCTTTKKRLEIMKKKVKNRIE